MKVRGGRLLQDWKTQLRAVENSFSSVVNEPKGLLYSSSVIINYLMWLVLFSARNGILLYKSE